MTINSKLNCMLKQKKTTRTTQKKYVSRIWYKSKIRVDYNHK